MNTNDTQPVKRQRGRPRKTEDIDRKIYQNIYYMSHRVPKERAPDSPKLGRPLKPDDQKLTHDMKAYQRQYRMKKKKLLNEL